MLQELQFLHKRTVAQRASLPASSIISFGTETRRESGQDMREFEEVLKRNWEESERRRKRWAGSSNYGRTDKLNRSKEPRPLSNPSNQPWTCYGVRPAQPPTDHGNVSLPSRQGFQRHLGTEAQPLRFFWKSF